MSTMAQHALDGALAVNAGVAQGRRELRLKKAVAKAASVIRDFAPICEGAEDFARELELAYAEAKP